jgi:hypothetical protein
LEGQTTKKPKEKGQEKFEEAKRGNQKPQCEGQTTQ